MQGKRIGNIKAKRRQGNSEGMKGVSSNMKSNIKKYDKNFRILRNIKRIFIEFYQNSWILGNIKRKINKYYMG